MGTPRLLLSGSAALRVGHQIEIIGESNEIYVEKQIGSVGEFVQEFMKLRNEGFWSFKEQRSSEWQLGLYSSRKDATTDVCLEQFKKRCMEFPMPNYIEEHDDCKASAVK